MGISLLIIESDGHFRENLSQHLNPDTFTVHESDDESIIESLIDSNRIDVVLLGLARLKRKGLSILKMIKMKSPATQVIIISDSRQIDLSIEGMKLGAFDDFMIPLDMDSLIQRIRDACDEVSPDENETDF
ncbi:MAG: response regulator [Desulfobacteraceae bacterium]|nr:response regulator [Desulfobacteraceae bacterium]